MPKNIIGSLFRTLGIKKKRKNNTIMRFFDTLNSLSQLDILRKTVQFAKREIVDNNLPANTDIPQLASDYCWQDGVTALDYDQISDEITNITAWVGPIPVKVPRP